MGALLDGPTAAESTAGFQSFLTGTSTGITATVVGGVATVDFLTDPIQVVGPDQTLAIAQVVYTATQQPGVTGVSFEIAGQAIEVPTASGAQVLRPGRPRRLPPPGAPSLNGPGAHGAVGVHRIRGASLQRCSRS